MSLQYLVSFGFNTYEYDIVQYQKQYTVYRYCRKLVVQSSDFFVFSAIIQGGNLAEMHQQVKTVIANEQKKAIWVPVCPRVQKGARPVTQHSNIPGQQTYRQCVVMRVCSDQIAISLKKESRIQWTCCNYTEDMCNTLVD